MKVKFLVHYAVLLILAGSGLSGCGKPESGKSEDSLRILVQIPENERAELFWFGVSRKEIEIKRGEESSIYPWLTGQTVTESLKEGDTLVFRALDSQGNLVVTGEATVGDGKIVSIPVRRVL